MQRRSGRSPSREQTGAGRQGPVDRPRQADAGALCGHRRSLGRQTAARRGQDPAAYARGTLGWLSGSGAFTSVQLGAPDAPGADLTATPIGTYCNTAAILLFTILTLGVIPTNLHGHRL